LKAVAVGHYATLQEQLARMQDFMATEQTRADVKVVIRNYLWDEKQGLPGSSELPEVESKTDAVFANIAMQARQSNWQHGLFH
jgi:type I restriction enzyme R subunit